jgi:uncharacterized protein
MTNFRPAIIVMAKAPRLGRAKTRLRGVLTDEETRTLALAFFADTLRYARKADLQIIIAFTPAAGLSELQGATSTLEEMIWVEQADGDLGERLIAAAEFARSERFWPVVFLGTDCPNLPVETVRFAMDHLENDDADIVLGPSADGGYYLIGLSRFNRQILFQVPWSTAEALEKTLANVASAGLRSALMDEWYDVDQPADLRRLREDVLVDPSSAPATHAWFEKYRDLRFFGVDDTSDRGTSDLLPPSRAVGETSTE